MSGTFVNPMRASKKKIHKLVKSVDTTFILFLEYFFLKNPSKSYARTSHKPYNLFRMASYGYTCMIVSGYTIFVMGHKL